MGSFSSAIGGFVIGESPIGGTAGFLPQPWAPRGPTTIQNSPPAYLYEQYQDDDQVRAFFDAYNSYAQAYLDYLNGLNLPVYTSPTVSGGLLDWVAQSLYGISRPGLPQGVTTPPAGPYNSTTYNALAYNAAQAGRQATYTLTTDDVFKRIITWCFYKGDGFAPSPFWLKRRINRFLNGANGTDILNDTPYAVSVAPTAHKAWTITLATTAMSTIFKAAVEAGVLPLPFQITWTITLT